MSNSQVGNVYQRIIEEVVNQCRAPFEEEGTRAEVLEDFKLAWQARISERKIAEMPWDPKAPPLPPPSQQAPQPRPAQYVPPPQQGANGDVKVKVEPNDLANLPSTQPVYTQANPNLAIQNARQAIHDKFGDRGAASIQQLEGRMTETSHGVKRPLPQSSPTSEEFDNKRRITEYNNGVQQAAQQRMQQLSAAQRQGAPPVGSAQTDGAADWKAMVAERRALALDGSDNADMTIAERVSLMQRDEEGWGVMQPHSDNMRRPRVRAAAVARRQPGAAAANSGGDFDGVDDDDDDANQQVINEEDAINSDLDDDEEENLEEEDDERAGEIMVCTYEKVARVKNKWKCTLKDGILVTGGKEYVFGKAQGEFEW